MYVTGIVVMLFTSHHAAHAIEIAGGDSVMVCSLRYPIVLKSTPGLQQYAWSNGSTVDSTIVTQAGKYWVRTVNGGVIESDTIVVVTSSLTIETFPTAQQYVCLTDTPFLLSSNDIFDPNGLWNNGFKGSILAAYTPGKYWFTAVDSNFCILQTDTVLVVGVANGSTLSFVREEVICNDAFPYQLDVNVGDSPLWQDSSTDYSFVADSAGLYSYQSFLGSCAVVYDTTVLMNRSVQPPVLCCDTAICMPDSLYLSLPAGFVDYYWSTGQNASTISIFKEGLFTVTVRVTDSLNCSATTNAIIVEVKDSLPKPIITQNGLFLVAQPAGYTYQWFRNDTLLAGATSPAVKNDVRGIYCVQLQNGVCSDTACFDYRVTTSISSTVETDGSIRLYPNPTTDLLLLECNSRPNVIVLTGIAGDILTTIYPVDSSVVLDVSSFAAGVYWVTVFFNNTQIKRGFFKQ